MRPGRGRRPQRPIRRPTAVVAVRPVRDDSDRWLRRDIWSVHAGHDKIFLVHVAVALFVQILRDRVDDAFHDETGVGSVNIF